MQKVIFLISGILLLSMDTVMIAFSIKENEADPPKSKIVEHSKKHLPSKIQDKNLLKGDWQRDDAPIELHILKILENGGLQVKYFNSKLIFVEKAGWTNSSDVLRLFVIYRQDDNSGYSLSLNYNAERDLLIGEYVDGSDNKAYTVTFKRME